MCFRKNFDERRLRRQIKRLSETERQAILEQSPLELGWYQGEGFHVFLKNEPDINKAYVASVGETYQQIAEDWIIRHYLLNNHENQY